MAWTLAMDVWEAKENVGTNPPGLQGTWLSNPTDAPGLHISFENKNLRDFLPSGWFDKSAPSGDIQHVELV
jgi:hypothetical protein